MWLHAAAMAAGLAASLVLVTAPMAHAELQVCAIDGGVGDVRKVAI